MKLMNTIAVLALLALASPLTLTGCQDSAQSETPALSETTDGLPGTGIPRSADAVPDFVLTDLDGNVVKLSDYSGQAVLINTSAYLNK